MRHGEGPRAAATPIGWLRRRLARLASGAEGEEIVLVTTSLVVGLSAGVAAVLFRYLIAGVEYVGYTVVPGLLSDYGRLYVFLVPTVGGLIVGWLVTTFAPEAKGHGVPEVMDAVARHGGRIRPAVVIVKSLASSICIGSGGSVGREGPIVQVGSAIGSVIGQKLRLSSARISNLVACGAAAGIAATFNAPIAGVIFALEVILGGRFGVRYFSSVVIAAVAASVVGRAAFGDFPAFRIPVEYGINSAWELLLYAVLGIVAALAGAGFVRVLYAAEDLFDGWGGPRPWAKPAIGGALLGLMALTYPSVTGVQWTGVPQVFNVGYDVIEQALASELTLSVLLTLFVLKLMATSLTLGSGGSGGVFAPSLFMGAMLGGAFEIVANILFPGLPGPPGAYALVGMAATFAASAHAPITAVIILFELTGDYRIILPLMLTTVLATLIAQRLLGGESIYSFKLTRRGVRLQSGRDVDIMSRVQVGEIMAHDVDTIPGYTPISELRDLFTRRRRTGLLVHDAEGSLAAVVTLSDLERAVDSDVPDNTPVASIATPMNRLEVVYPDDSMGTALARMGARGIGRLPVVAREDGRRLLGVIRREDIIRGYQLAATRGETASPRPAAGSAPQFQDADFVDVRLARNHHAVNQPVHRIAQQLPDDSVIVAIDRDGRLVIPHGDTVLRAGDYLTAFVRRSDAERLVRVFKEGADQE